VTIVIPIVSEFQGKGFKEAEKSTNALDKGLKRLAVTLGAALSTRKIAQFGKASIMAASDLEEAITKVNVVFGRGSAEVEAFGKNSATALGISSAAALEAAGTYGNLLQAFGIGQREAQGMSTSLVQLAADMASFNNTSIDQAITALRSGLSGETEPLKRYGVALQDVRLKTEALRMGLIKTTSTALTPAVKAQAAYALIIKDTTLAQGDFARTSDGVANSLKILSASANNAQTIIGTKLIESMDLLIDRKDGVDALAKSFEGLATNLGNAILGYASLIDKIKSFGGLGGDSGLSFKGLLPNIPGLRAYNLLNRLGSKLTAEKEFKQNALTNALAKEQGMLASKNFKIEKNKTKELEKQNKLKKDDNKLAKAGSMLDIEKIQIEAALQGQLTDNEKLRLQLMKALVNENAERAEMLAGKLKESQTELLKLSNFKPYNPFDAWIDSLNAINERLKTIGSGAQIGSGVTGGMGGGVTGGMGGGVTGGDGANIFGPGYGRITDEEAARAAANIIVNVQGSVVTQEELEEVIKRTVFQASAAGISTTWFRTTGTAVAGF
jgi:hypothetical protein